MSLQNLGVEFSSTIYRLNRAINDRYQQLMRAEGLSDVRPSVGVVLLPLLEEQGQTISSLAQALHMKVPTVTVIANRLEEQGWIKRERGEEDRRKVRLYLTESGRRVAEVMMRVRRKTLQTMTAGIDREKMAIARELMEQAYTNLKKKA